ncbi:hypothetical protein [Natronospira sp.]|uniref:hypothetical protein n=1 Tax=Natronospira sp. TaxID=2024970 RepID=UPI003872D40B
MGSEKDTSLEPSPTFSHRPAWVFLLGSCVLHAALGIVLLTLEDLMPSEEAKPESEERILQVTLSQPSQPSTEEDAQAEDLLAVQEDLLVESPEDDIEDLEASEPESTELEETLDSLEAEAKELASEAPEPEESPSLNTSTLEDDMRSAAREVVQESQGDVQGNGAADGVFDPNLREQLARYEPGHGSRQRVEPDRVRDFYGDEMIYGDDYCFRVSEMPHGGETMVLPIPCPSDSGGGFSLDPDR